MRRDAIYAGAIVLGLLLASVGGAVAFNATVHAPVVPPPVVPVPPIVAADPELVIVIDDAGKRIDNKAIEDVAAKLEVGTWHVEAIPKPGDFGWTRTIVVSEGVKPPPLPPVPPQPPLPPVPTPITEGKRSLLIVYEASAPKVEVSQLITNLQAGEQAKYLASKGHTLHVLDAQAKSADGALVLDKYQPLFTGMAMPVFVIVDPSTKTLLHKESLPPAATADDVIKILKSYGG